MLSATGRATVERSRVRIIETISFPTLDQQVIGREVHLHIDLERFTFKIQQAWLVRLDVPGEGRGEEHVLDIVGDAAGHCRDHVGVVHRRTRS